MKIVEQSWSLAQPLADGKQILEIIEAAGRTCYKSQAPIGTDSEAFVRKLIASGHESVLEHYSISLRIVTDRGISHEIVRHRVGMSYSQESTRYCNYSKDRFGKEIVVIMPVWFRDKPNYESGYAEWLDACENAEGFYFKLLELGQTPQQARSVLPNSLKTEIVVTGNLRSWRHFLKLRTSAAAHPQMRDLACDILKHFKFAVPAVFDDIVL